MHKRVAMGSSDRSRRDRNRVLNLEKCLRQVMALMDGEDIVEFRKMVFDLFKARCFVDQKEQATF